MPDQWRKEVQETSTGADHLMQVEEKVEAEKDINLTKKSLDLCARCGRQLIVIKVTKELVGNSMVTTTQMSCTDSVCQKGLELQLAKE